DVATAFVQAWRTAADGENYLLGAANWTFADYFEALSRCSGVSMPRLRVKPGTARWAARVSQLAALYVKRDVVDVEPEAIDMAECYWYIDSAKAARDLGFTAREPL